jgi:hypothetical protein
MMNKDKKFKKSHSQNKDEDSVFQNFGLSVTFVFMGRIYAGSATVSGANARPPPPCLTDFLGQ